jgi:hypothetical protein
MSKPVPRIAGATLAMITGVMASAQAPVDDSRVRQIESEILRLQQQVDFQARRIEALEQAARIRPPASPISPGIRAPDSAPVWLDTANWDRVKTGMSVQEIIAILGRPTSTRNDDAGQLSVMFYAMELGQGKYLSGSIRLEGAVVAGIHRPELK